MLKETQRSSICPGRASIANGRKAALEVLQTSLRRRVALKPNSEVLANNHTQNRYSRKFLI